MDTALSTVDTYAGNPTAAGARTPDHDADGNPSDRGEEGGRDRIENTLGARFSDMGNGRDAFNRLENTLRNSGHGSQAVIITQDVNGRAHAWNAVNHNGKITYIDAQTGQQSSKPLHSGDNGVFAIPLDRNREPVSPGSASAGDRSRPDSSNQADRGTPASAAGTDRRPSEEPAGADPKKDDQNLPDDPTREERNKSLPKPEDRAEEHSNLPPDSPQQAVRNYQSDDQDTHKAYDPDAPRGLKVYRIGLDPVHDSLRNWADAGRLTPLLQTAADRMDAYNQARENGETDLPATAFTRQELEDALGEDFRQMNDGQRYAVVASLARLSLGYHESQGVGHNPEHDREGRPYAGSKRSDGTDDVASDSDRAVSAEARDEANAKFPKMYRSDPETNKNISELHHRLTGQKKANPSNDNVNALIDALAPHKPDFSGKNYAVIEVVDNNGNSTFVVDSSVPGGQQRCQSAALGETSTRLVRQDELRSGRPEVPGGRPLHRAWALRFRTGACRLLDTAAYASGFQGRKDTRLLQHHLPDRPPGRCRPGRGAHEVEEPTGEQRAQRPADQYQGEENTHRERKGYAEGDG
ncbi:toxin glutamine deamidase domain-containing protein [Streptomyces sp. NPDC055013]